MIATRSACAAACVALLCAVAAMRPAGVLANTETGDTREADDDGMPFGPVSEGDVRSLFELGKERGIDLDGDLKIVYGTDWRAAGEALRRVFRFALVFERLDARARTFGHVLYCSLLNAGERIGMEGYVALLKREEPAVQQRVLDYLYFACRLQARAPVDLSSEEKLLFPSTFKFGDGDPVFSDSSGKNDAGGE